MWNWKSSISDNFNDTDHYKDFWWNIDLLTKCVVIWSMHLCYSAFQILSQEYNKYSSAVCICYDHFSKCVRFWTGPQSASFLSSFQYGILAEITFVNKLMAWYCQIYQWSCPIEPIEDHSCSDVHFTILQFVNLTFQFFWHNLTCHSFVLLFSFNQILQLCRHLWVLRLKIPMHWSVRDSLYLHCKENTNPIPYTVRKLK